MRKCPNCGSIWVCWNWIHFKKEVMEQLNPDRTFLSDEWVHECWDCEDVFHTDDEVFNGIEYEKLCSLWTEPVRDKERKSMVIDWERVLKNASK